MNELEKDSFVGYLFILQDFIHQAVNMYHDRRDTEQGTRPGNCGSFLEKGDGDRV